MKKRFKIFTLLFISTFMFSCHGLLGSIESPEQKTNDDNSSYCTVTASIKNDMDPGLNARSASSHIDFEAKKFIYQINAKATGNPEQSFFIEDKSFSLNLLKGATWKIQIKAFLVDKAFVIGTDFIPTGTAPVLVSNEISFLAGGEESFPSSIALHVNPDDSGNVNLKVTITHDGDPSLSNPIQSCKVTFIDKTLRSSPQANIVKEYGLVTESGENKIKIDYAGMYSGYYLMVMDFYTGALSSNHVTGSVIYTRTEMITVLPESASVDYPIQWDFAGNVDLTIPTSLVNGYRNHTVYVNSEIEEEGKFGTYYDPFTTVEKAVDYIKTVNDGNDENIFYQIVLLNDYSKEVAPGSVLALTTSRNLNLTLKSYGSNFYSITNESTSSTCAVKINAENSSTVKLKIENIALIGKSAHVTSNSGTASGLYVTDGVPVQIAGTCYISSVGGESDSFLTVQSLGTVYQDSTGKITNKSNDGAGNENTLVPKNIKYIPSSYDADNKKINLPAEEGDTTYTKIGIHDQIGSVETKKWTLLSNGFIEIDLPYVSRLTEEPVDGDTIYVKTAQDLEALARLVNTGTNGIITMTTNGSLKGITVEQTDHIDLSAYSDWVPIGGSNPFSGDYDGKNYNITNLTISGETYRNSLGLFGSKNDGEIRNCNVSGTITLSDAYSSKRSYIGGLVGILYSSGSNTKIYNCISNVEITDENSKSYIGGLIGYVTDKASVYNCVNMGKIHRTSAGQTGGLIGTISGSYTSVIYNCINNGEIEALSTSTSNDVGGIVGLLSAAADISNVINNGDIKINNNYSPCIGGLIGNTGSSFYLKNCVMAGQMSNSKGGKYFSLVGSEQNNYGYSNCYYLSSNPEPKNPFSPATLTDCSSFTLNDPMDDWYGTLETPVNAGDATNVIALVYALNQWVEKNTGTQTYSQWCVTDEKLTFGTAPTGTPPAPFFLSDAFKNSIQSLETGGTIVYVETADDLKAVSDIVNTDSCIAGSSTIVVPDSTFAGITVEQTAEIDLSGYPDWISIGELNQFSGVYDGKNYNIKNLSITNTKLNIDDTDRNNLGLFGKVVDGQIKNCNVYGTISVSSLEKKFNGNIGSIAAYVGSNSIIQNCISYVEINDLGYASNEALGAKVGGIVGTIEKPVQILDCVNNGKIYKTSADAVGGIVGEINKTSITSAYYARIYNCINNGEIEDVNTTSKVYVGGIVGSLSNKTSIFNTINNGDIKGVNGNSTLAGGIVGVFSSTINIENCVMAGKMIDWPSGKYYSLIAGQSNNATGSYKNCYYLSSNPDLKNPSSTVGTITDCSSFTLNDPMDDWYGTLETPVNAGDATNVIALVYALNQWVEKNTGTQTYSHWCVTDGKLAFGTAPTGTPPTASTSSLSNIFRDSIQQMKNGDTTVYVETPEDLKALARLVNSGAYIEGSDDIEITSEQQKFTGITVVQTADIDLSDLYDAESFPSWVAIGNEYTNRFEGIYNGNNFIIDNLKVNVIETNSSSQNYGLFGYVRKGEILNCNVKGSINVSGDSLSNNGSIVATLDGGSVTNCTSYVRITCSTTSSSNYAAGGIVGIIPSLSSSQPYINNCVNIGDITVSENTCYAGGIVGNISSTCEVINCINKGTILNNSSRNSYLASGGIVGYTGVKIKVQNCYNNGEITSLNLKGNAGGIVGKINTPYATEISNCVNNGNIANYAYKFGIIGNDSYSSTSIKVLNCHYSDSLSAIIESDDILAQNNESFTSAQLSTLPTALNNWVDTANASDPDKYLSWAYESSKGLYLLPPPVVANPPIAGHTYASTMASAPSSGTVYIREAADLQQISTWSKTSKLENVTFVMDYDVSLEGVDWNQIGYSSTYRFGGIFDGNGKEILKLSKTVDGDFGFFQRTDGATIKNLKISGEIIITGTGGNYGAGFIAYAENTTVRNCINNVNITNKSNSNSGSTNPLTGGIIAICHTTNTIIDGCMNTGTISAKYKGSQIGGIVGSVTAFVTIRNSINKGEIRYEGTSTSNINLGGIIANFNTSDTGYFTIENCANKANFVVTSADSATVSAGGIIGLESKTKAESVIKNCFSIGQIEFPGKNPTDLSISQAGINPTSGSLTTMTNCYWDNTKMPNWKNGDNTEDPDNFIKSVNSNSDYYMGPIGSYTYGYLKSYLQLWVDENNTDSLYQNWALAPGGQEERGQGEPILPIESGITP